MKMFYELSLTLPLIINAVYTADPLNATFFEHRNEIFNITQYYYRDYLAKHVGLGAPCYDYIARKPLVHFYVDEFDLPGKVIEYKLDIFNRIYSSEIVNREKIRKVIENTVFLVFNKIGIRSVLLPTYGHYKYYKLNSALMPLKINFKSSPYSQSNFREFVSNIDINWEVPVLTNYNPIRYRIIMNFYKKHVAGNKADLLYRFSHNLMHSLGLGHSRSIKCIMHAGNIKGLYETCQEELEALHKMLCSKTIEINKYV